MSKKIKKVDTLDAVELDISDLQTISDKIANELKKVDEEISRVSELYAEQRRVVQSLFDSEVNSLKDLKRVGAITRQDYEDQIAEAQKRYNAEIAVINHEESKQLSVLEAIRDQLNKGILVEFKTTTTSSTGEGGGGGSGMSSPTIDWVKKALGLDIPISTLDAITGGRGF